MWSSTKLHISFTISFNSWVRLDSHSYNHSIIQLICTAWARPQKITDQQPEPKLWLAPTWMFASRLAQTPVPDTGCMRERVRMRNVLNIQYATVTCCTVRISLKCLYGVPDCTEFRKERGTKIFPRRVYQNFREGERRGKVKNGNNGRIQNFSLRLCQESPTSAGMYTL